MRVWILPLLLLPGLLLAQTPADSSATDSVDKTEATGTVKKQDSDSHILDDIVIEGNYEGNYEEDKPPLRLDLDFSDVVQFEDGITWHSADASLHLSQPDAAPGIAAIRLAAPDLAQIRPQPVKSFRAEFKNLKHWTLQITAADGSVYKTITGQGNPPETVSWGGLSDSGEVLKAGRNYAYNFMATDKAGNQGSFPGQTFTVPAFYVRKENGIVIGLDSELILMKDGYSLRPQAESYVHEVVSLVRYFGSDAGISVHCGNIDIAAFVARIAGQLVIDPADIAVHRIEKDHSLTINVE